MENHENIIDLFYHTKLRFVIDRMHILADLAVGAFGAPLYQVLVDHESNIFIIKNTQYLVRHN